MRLIRFNIKKLIAVASIASLLATTSCVKDLEQTPITDTTAQNIYSNFQNYPSALAKVYGGFASGGQKSGGDNADLTGLDGNFQQYTRLLFTTQVLPTDEAVIAWNDGTLQTIHKMSWDASNEFIAGMYYRIYVEIAFANDFIKNTTDDKLAANGITGSDLTEAKFMRTEARFLRALAYYHALDLFGNVPFVDENYQTGSNIPPARISRADLFKYIETELSACATGLKDAKTNAYGRADKAAAWSLLARLYLNAEVYTGTKRYADCITNCEKVLASGYSLKSKYEDLFLADNDKNNPENIFSIYFDGIHMQTYGGSTYMVHAAIGGGMTASQFGVGGGWGGLRTTKSFVGLFDPSDLRGRFFTAGQNLEIDDLGNFKDGYAFIKYKNITSTGAEGSDGPTNGSGNFCDADIPIFRLADIYLMYAEANLRGGGGSAATAVANVNLLRARAGVSQFASLSLDGILDERARELSWECTRRTDLIRYGKFTTASYLWPWKGGVKTGVPVEDYRNLYPIPAKDLVANPNLTQNTGY